MRRHEKVRDGGRVARKCVVVPHAVHETGRCEIIGLDVGEARGATADLGSPDTAEETCDYCQRHTRA